MEIETCSEIALWPRTPTKGPEWWNEICHENFQKCRSGGKMPPVGFYVCLWVYRTGTSLGLSSEAQKPGPGWTNARNKSISTQNYPGLFRVSTRLKCVSKGVRVAPKSFLEFEGSLDTIWSIYMTWDELELSISQTTELEARKSWIHSSTIGFLSFFFVCLFVS